MSFHPLLNVGIDTVKDLWPFIIGGVVFCVTIRSFWRLYFHPLSRYPGPKVAALSDAWYAYHSLAGRWPWAVEDVLKKYGDIVRIAPNELVFVTPRALADLYGSHNKNLEVFPKTQINNHGNDEHGGIIWEWDPVRHRTIAKQLAPAFSGRALKAKEPTLHRYIDLFVDRMSRFGLVNEGVNLADWVNWVCVDISADMAYNRQMDALKEMKNPPYLYILSKLNKATVVIQTSWRFPLLGVFKYLYLLAGLKSHSSIKNHSRAQLEHRIRRQGAVEHLDFIEQLIPEDRKPPKNRKEMRHLEQVAGQLLIAGYEPPALWLFYTIFFLVKERKCLSALRKEIGTAFAKYEDITPGAAKELPYLTACLREGLRMMPNLLTGMPVVSPGAVVDGTFIPKGVVCQSSPFALARSPRNFYAPLSFKPERWLAEDHPLYDPIFKDDNRNSFHPFSQGPRMCVGKEIAWWQCRLFVAKVIWTFSLELLNGEIVDVDRDMRGWGIFQKPEVRVRFTASNKFQ